MHNYSRRRQRRAAASLVSMAERPWPRIGFLLIGPLEGDSTISRKTKLDGLVGVLVKLLEQSSLTLTYLVTTPGEKVGL